MVGVATGSENGAKGENYSPFLAPRYAVRNYFREQNRAATKLYHDTASVFGPLWLHTYQSGKLTAAKLTQLAAEFTYRISEAGAFSIQQGHVAGSRSLPQREKRSVSGFFMEPMGLAQSFLPGEEKFVEQAVMLRSCQAEFRLKKSSIGYGAGCLVLTQHLLERVYERTEIDHNRLAPLIHTELADLLHGLSLAEATGLWLLTEPDGHRVTAVPYSHGLMLVNCRILFGDALNGGFGFRFSYPSGQEHTPFINPRNLLDHIGPGFPFQPDCRPILITCGVTYFNLTTLNDVQADYYHRFQVLKDAVGADILSALSLVHYSPQFPHEKLLALELNETGVRMVDKLRPLLHMGWLKAPQTRPICVMASSDYG
jgi:hypothetical protein